MEATGAATPEVDRSTVRRFAFASRVENIRRNWYKFSRNTLSMVGFGTIATVILLAIFAPLVAPYPEHAGPFTDFANAGLPPNPTYPFGTDMIGRDILSRIISRYAPP